nr:DDE-type integrase/transposase/recombinase [Clostridium sp. ZBS14]
MIKDFFSEDYRVDKGVKKPIIKTRNEIPTFNQFRYWFNKERNIKKEISTRISAKKYEQTGRSIIGSSTKEALGPASLYQIDATIADIYICSSFNRNWIIGRPVIYNVMDVFSREIVGISISLEGPSWIGAMAALANCVSNKVEFCKEYDVDIKEEEWPVHYRPDAILADRGELEGKNIENLINGLGVKIQNTPPYRAELKGVIEQHFNIINNQRIQPFLPGAIDPDTRERGDRDYRLDAKLNIKEFTQIIIKCVLYHNNNHILKSYSREEMMIEDDILSVPINLWNWGINNRSGRLRYIEEEIVKLNLMPSDMAIVTARGIQFKGVFYACSAALKEKWFEKARRNGTWKIEVSYDSRNMNFLYIKKDNCTDYEKCFLLDH